MDGGLPAQQAPLERPAEMPLYGPQAAARSGVEEITTHSSEHHHYESPFGDAPKRTLRRRAGSAAAGVVAVAAKFGTTLKALLVALPNLKLLTTAGTAMVSIAAYSLLWGWQFAVGFVVLLFVHEMGHVVALRREGIHASAPMFIPFLGAVIAARSLGDSALAEARVGLAGPILGSLGAAACLAIGEAANSNFFRALAYVGFFLNLFNLIPMLPLDGGRAMAAMAPWMWFVGLAAMVPLLFLFPHGFIILIILLFGGRELWHRWQLRKTRTLEQAAYYRVSPRARTAVAVVYVGLIVLLAVGMDTAYISRTIS
jgi:Zn-dependent protease